MGGSNWWLPMSMVLVHGHAYDLGAWWLLVTIVLVHGDWCTYEGLVCSAIAGSNVEDSGRLAACQRHPGHSLGRKRKAEEELPECKKWSRECECSSIRLPFTTVHVMGLFFYTSCEGS